MSCQQSVHREGLVLKRVHHDLPGIHGQISVVERPVELLLGLRFISRVVVGGKVFVCKRVGGRDSFLGIEDEHFLEEVHGCERQRPNRPHPVTIKQGLPSGSAFLNLFARG